MSYLRNYLKYYIVAISKASLFQQVYWKWLRLVILTGVDLVLTGLAFYWAFVLRLDSFSFGTNQESFQQSLPIFLGSNLAAFLLFGMYRQLWRRAHFKSAVLIGKLVLLGTLTSVFFLWIRGIYIPKSVPFIFFTVSFILNLTVKFSWKALNALPYTFLDLEKNKCFIYGAGEAGGLLLRHMKLSSQFPFRAIGFIDDDLNKKNRVVDGLPILGDGRKLAKLAKKFGVSSILIAIHDLTGKELRWILSQCQDAGLKPLIMPNLAFSMAEKIPDPRPVHIQDLLRRSPKSVQKEVIKDFFQSRTVLVTGAGGSIGSEICRQILETNPGVLLLLESSEYNLYKIQRELEEKKTSIPIIGIMGNVTDEAFIDHVFLNHRPDYVLHAAAYKHVPLVESNPLSGILNNIEGTKIVANACIRYHVRNFLLVSTDKAVRPTNVMGMTKRACEILVQSLHQLHGHGCRFSAVRFGNVLGSSGSVIPLFMDQIKKGGPVTVTDPEMTRYFMLISEAVGLVLQSAVKSRGGEIFVLDMGDPVNILEMAKQLIRLAGKEPGQDIDIVITGLRPGEKIFEELIIEGAERHELHEDIYIARPENFSGTLALEMIDNLLVYAKGYKTQEALVILADLASNSLHKNFSSPIIVKDLPCISL